MREMIVIVDSLVVDPNPDRNWNPDAVGEKVISALREGNEALVTNIRDMYFSIAYQFAVTSAARGTKVTCENRDSKELLYKLA